MQLGRRKGNKSTPDTVFGSNAATEMALWCLSQILREIAEASPPCAEKKCPPRQVSEISAEGLPPSDHKERGPHEE
jgi:hypothetical protein